MSDVDTILQLECQLAEPDTPSIIADHHRRIDALNNLSLTKLPDKYSRQASLIFQPDHNPFNKFVIIPGFESGPGIMR